MKNLVATWASGTEFCRSNGFSIYIKSLDVITNADKFVFTHDMPDDIRLLLKNKNIIVKDIDSKLINFLIRDRYFVYWNFLIQNQNTYKYCIFTDSKDVIFQRNPFDYMINDLKGYVMLIGEGITHSQSGWNSIDQFECQRNVREYSTDLGKVSVINGGVLLGTLNELKHLFILLWTNTVRTIGTCTEQAVLNYLYSFLNQDPLYILLDPLFHIMCLTGEAVKEGFIKPCFRDGKFLHHRNETPYFIVHQWERTEYVEAVLAQYSN